MPTSCFRPTSQPLRFESAFVSVINRTRGFAVPRCPLLRAFVPVFAFLVLLTCPRAAAQAQESGTIAGRVLNPATGKYVGNAEIRVNGTDLSTVSDAEGNYRITRVPAGTATVAVTFTGYRTATGTVDVAPGSVATKDFEIISTELGKDEKAITLAAFTVSSEREGNAKAIMAQKNSMNIMNSVSWDAFGTSSEGNVGEFLKYLPGVDLEYVEADTRTPRLGGLDPSYTGVTLNGMGMASADAFQQANGTDNVRAGSGNRSFGFEQVSINSIESIEQPHPLIGEFGGA